MCTIDTDAQDEIARCVYGSLTVLTKKEAYKTAAGAVTQTTRNPILRILSSISGINHAGGGQSAIRPHAWFVWVVHCGKTTLLTA
jgi:hypothetical protein